MDLNSRSTLNHESTWTKFSWGRAALLVFLLLLLTNILFLDFEFFSRGRFRTEPELELRTPVPFDTGQAIQNRESEVIPAEINFCPAACLALISEATVSALAQITPMPTPTSVSVVSEPTIKEFYIPLGRGSATSKDWVELTGTEAVVDMANYPNVKSIIFEASMRIPTANGKVYAKLYNVTDQHDVWYSEVWAEGPSGYRAESAEITLSPGRKLYRVMMKSTMSYEAVLDSARIKILLK